MPTKFDPEVIAFWAMVAMKLGKEIYLQMMDLLGPSIPTWDELATENAELQAMIDAAKG